MAQHNEFGRWGEEIACRHLATHDYRLLHRNWQCGHLEVDIIADHFGEIVFVEVKTRHDELYQDATDAIDLSKKQHLISAAKAFMNYYKVEQPYRFDIITIVGTTASYAVNHIENAFTPEGIRSGI